MQIWFSFHRLPLNVVGCFLCCAEAFQVNAIPLVCCSFCCLSFWFQVPNIIAKINVRECSAGVSQLRAFRCHLQSILSLCVWLGVAWGRAGGVEPRLAGSYPPGMLALRGQAGRCWPLRLSLSSAQQGAGPGLAPSGTEKVQGRAVSPRRAARWHSRPAQCPAAAPDQGTPALKLIVMHTNDSAYSCVSRPDTHGGKARTHRLSRQRS